MFLFLYFIKIIFLDNIFRQQLEIVCAEKKGNHVAHRIGWFYMVTTYVIQLSIGCQ